MTIYRICVAGGSGLALSDQLIPATHHAQCEAMLTFVHLLVGLVLPIWLLCRGKWDQSRFPSSRGSGGGKRWPGAAAVEFMEAAVWRWSGCSPTLLAEQGEGLRKAGRLRLLVEWWILIALLWAASAAFS